MRFELSIALKYLVPKRKQLSVALIALLSIGVIALVVWLILLFLSVTEGIEKSWLKKLTAVQAPLRIVPTENYYNSYYYNIDKLSAGSHFTTKTIGEKAVSPFSDPYREESDWELPFYFPKPDRHVDGTLLDPVKELFSALDTLKERTPSLVYQDYEVGGALLRIQMIRPSSLAGREGAKETQAFLSQASLIASFPDKSSDLFHLILPPSVDDLNQLLFLSTFHLESSRQDTEQLLRQGSIEEKKAKLERILSFCSSVSARSDPFLFKIPFELLPEKMSFRAEAVLSKGKVVELVLLESKKEASEASLVRESHSLIYQRGGETLTLSPHLPVRCDIPLELALDMHKSPAILSNEKLGLHAHFSIQGKSLEGIIPLEGVAFSQAQVKTQFSAQPSTQPVWGFAIQKEAGTFSAHLPKDSGGKGGIILSKNFKESGVRLGDSGYLSYVTTSLSGAQEQRLPIYVCGFYDSGVLGIGNRCLFVDKELARILNASSNSQPIDPSLTNGIQIWFPNISETDAIKAALNAKLEESHLSKYWKVSSFKEYDYVKDLYGQFQSDKYLFTLVGALILIVACSNIISLLMLLVNDKKREIGILQSMGASSLQIASIFGLCGAVLGLMGTLLGTLAAWFTLSHIDSIVHLLSVLQGQETFNAAFYGDSLPREMSASAIGFILLITPLLSLLAGLVPALRATKFHLSTLLRS